MVCVSQTTPNQTPFWIYVSKFLKFVKIQLNTPMTYVHMQVILHIAHSHIQASKRRLQHTEVYMACISRFYTAMSGI